MGELTLFVPRNLSVTMAVRDVVWGLKSNPQLLYIVTKKKKLRKYSWLKCKLMRIEV